MTILNKIETRPLRIYITGGSPALPRPSPKGSSAVSYRDQSLSVVSALEPVETKLGVTTDLITNVARMRTMFRVSASLGEVFLFNPPIIIVHARIDECAPRIFSPRLHASSNWLGLSWAQTRLLGVVGKSPEDYRYFTNQGARARGPFPSLSQANCPRMRRARRQLGTRHHLPTESTLRQAVSRGHGNLQPFNRALEETVAKDLAAYIDFHHAVTTPAPEDYLLDNGHHDVLLAIAVLPGYRRQRIKSVVQSAVGPRH